MMRPALYWCDSAGGSLSCKGRTIPDANAFWQFTAPIATDGIPIYAIIPMLAQTHLLEQLDALTAAEQQGFIRLRAAMDVTSLIGWLKEQPLFPRIYWHARERDREFAALGAIRELTDPTQLASLTGQLRPHAGSYPRYYGGLAFDYQQPVTDEWQEFGQCRFVLPRIELIRQGNQTELVCNLWFDGNNHAHELTAAREALQQLQPETTLTHYLPAQRERHDTPDKPRWMQWLSQVLQPDALKIIPKVVLSRRTTLQFSETLNPWDLLATWQSATPACFHIGYQFSPESCFIASSPERLYRRHDRQLFSEALAGSTPRTGDAEQDAELASLLLQDGKNRLENRFVHTDILTRLDGLADTAVVSEAQILPLKHIQHIKREIEATLLPETADWQLLQKVHPTPAVGGSPRRKALSQIRALEQHQRGWYAGACGFISEDVSEFTVAIRSGLWHQNQLHLYTGAGILTGSDAEAEWQELDTKLNSMLGVWHD